MISIIIPTKNEPLINELIKDIHRVLTDYEHEIIVVDNSDLRPKIIDAHLVFQKSDGLGNAIVEGLHHAKGNAIAVMDGDFSHDPKDLPKLLEKIDGLDIVIGSRYISDGGTEDSIHRKLVSLFFNRLASSTLNLDVKDSMSGFSVVKREVYDNLKLNPIGYKINMEIMFKGKRKGYKVCEVPIVFHRRRSGKTKTGLSFAGVMEFFRILRYILELRLGLR